MYHHTGPSAYWNPAHRGGRLGDVTTVAPPAPSKGFDKKLLVMGGLLVFGAWWLWRSSSSPRKNPSRPRRRRGPRRRARRRNPGRKWMKGAVKRPGALRRKVDRWYGARGFDSRGRIKASVLRELKRTGGPRHDTRTKRQANLALVFRRSA